MNEIIRTEWYDSLVNDCKSIITGAVITSRWALVEGYHQLGERITEENNNFERAKIYGEKIVHDLAQSLNISKRTLYYAIQFYQKYPDLYQVPEGKNITWNKIKTKYLPTFPQEIIPLPEGKFGVIYADPPWPYPERLDSKNLYGNIKYHYDTMSIKDICSLKVNDLIAENSVLFIWVATYFLEKSFQIIKDWGFNYKSNIVWVKEGGPGGIGWYVWGDHELLLIATHGSYLPKTKKLVSSVVKSPREEASKKPDIFYEIIEYLYPDDKYIELFARNQNKREGWSYWGNEAI